MISGRKPIIGVMGGSQCDGEIYELARQVGRLIAERGAVLLCGGRGGVMEGAAKGAREAGGLTIGIMPGGNVSESPPNPYIDIPIFTGLGDARNAINVKTADVVIAVSGGYGTLSEIALALKNDTPVVGLKTWGFQREGFLKSPLFVEADSPEGAVEKAFGFIRR